MILAIYPHGVGSFINYIATVKSLIIARLVNNIARLCRSQLAKCLASDFFSFHFFFAMNIYINSINCMPVTDLDEYPIHPPRRNVTIYATNIIVLSYILATIQICVEFILDDKEDVYSSSLCTS